MEGEAYNEGEELLVGTVIGGEERKERERGKCNVNEGYGWLSFDYTCKTSLGPLGGAGVNFIGEKKYIYLFLCMYMYASHVNY